MGRSNTVRRRLTGAGLGKTESSSEPNLGSTSLTKGFPPSITVDELHLYSRRKASDAQNKSDNVVLEYSSLKDIATEYQTCFKAPPVESYSPRNIMGRTDESKESMSIRRYSSQFQDTLNKFEDIDLGLSCSKWYRPPEEQNLKLEGDMLFQTENRDEFVEYALDKRPDLLRRQTQLRLEGDIETLTENREQFVPYDNIQRPPLSKRITNLHLEGEHFYVPEYKEFFVEFPRQRPTIKRPSPWLRVDPEAKMNTDSETLSQFVEHILNNRKSEILRRPPNLKCEGDIALMPEYRDSFREYPSTKKQYAIRKLPSLKLEGQLYATPEYREKFITFPMTKIKPIKHFDNLQLGDDTIMSTNARPEQPSEYLKLTTESGLTVSTDNTAKPTTPIKTKPLDIHKPITGTDYTAITYKKYSPTTHNKTKITHSNKPSEENVTAKPPRVSRSRAPSRASAKRDIQLRRTPTRFDVETNKNQNETTVNYWIKQPNNGDHKVEKNLESKPEYRRAYLDYLIRERIPKSRSPDVERKKVAKPTEKSNDPATDEKTLNTDNNNLSDFSPLGRRRSASGVSFSPRRRSASPAYKMHVTNVDEPKRGFGRTDPNFKRKERSPSLEYVNRNENFKNSNRVNWIRSIAQNDDDFGYQNQYRNSRRNSKSFVILDNEENVSQTKKKPNSPWWRSTLEY